MRFCFIGDEDGMRGFLLAGIAARHVATADEARAAMEDAVAQPDCGVIIMTESVAEWIRREVEAIRMERDRPLIVEIAGAAGPLAERKNLSDLVQEAVGVHVE